jgi:hypothetical protein
MNVYKGRSHRWSTLFADSVSDTGDLRERHSGTECQSTVPNSSGLGAAATVRFSNLVEPPAASPA